MTGSGRMTIQKLPSPAVRRSGVLDANLTAFALILGLAVLPCGCRSATSHRGPVIAIDHIPPAAAGGPDVLDRIEGHVVGITPGDRVVVYAQNNLWWIQPFRDRPFTEVRADGTWNSFSHLGMNYAVLLVAAGYEPPPKVQDIPIVGDKVLAVLVEKGSSAKPQAAKVIHFSGYDWKVRSSPGNHGGELTDYEPSNVWVDERGYLHLLMGQEEGQWHCAGVGLSRSLGYGTYRFVVQDSSHLPPSAVLAMFTRDDRQDQADRVEMDIELSRWGKEENRNADYVVQPYYMPENTIHFNVPKGPVTYYLHWSPGSATFRTLAGDATERGREITSHVFKSGVPVPANETVRLDFYDFRHAQHGLQHPVEVVLEKFEYVP